MLSYWRNSAALSRNGATKLSEMPLVCSADVLCSRRCSTIGSPGPIDLHRLKMSATAGYGTPPPFPNGAALGVGRFHLISVCNLAKRNQSSAHASAKWKTGHRDLRTATCPRLFPFSSLRPSARPVFPVPPVRAFPWVALARGPVHISPKWRLGRFTRNEPTGAPITCASVLESACHETGTPILFWGTGPGASGPGASPQCNSGA